MRSRGPTSICLALSFPACGTIQRRVQASNGKTKHMHSTAVEQTIPVAHSTTLATAT